MHKSAQRPSRKKDEKQQIISMIPSYIQAQIVGISLLEITKVQGNENKLLCENIA